MTNLDKFRFTTRQREVALLAIQGFTSKEMAETLQLSPDTIYIHLRAMRKKCKAETVRRAVFILVNT